MPLDTSASPHADDAPEPAWSELYIVVRPDEKLAVERALQCVVSASYTMMTATGRGPEGGLVYGQMSGRRWWPFAGARAPAVVLPQVIFYAVLPEGLVSDALVSVRAALRRERGPGHDLGAAFVLPMERSITIGAPRRRGAAATAGATEDFDAAAEE